MPPLVLDPGDVVDDRFTIERFVRSGGMGAVYRAHDRRSGRAVALKIVLGAPLHDDELRFEREALALAGLNHPGIVRYVAHGVAAEDRRYLAMEWIEGEDLGARLARGPLGVDEARTLGLRLAGALGAAHARGVVHRDLKPSNVLLPGGAIAEATIVDFGLALFPEANRATLTGTVLGTPAYMAPERARGETDVDPRVDVFALGCILHEALGGKPLFEGAQIMAVLAKIVFEEAPRLRALGHDVPPELDALIARMLAKAASDRPADGGAVSVELAEAGMVGRGSIPVSSRPEPAHLTRAEQRIVCLLLARAASPPDGAPVGETLRSRGSRAPRAALETVERRGARAISLADGTLVVTTPGVGLAVDQAALAASSALALRAALPGWALTVVTGRAEVGVERAVGDAIERAAQRLGARLASERAAIDLDEATAGLLDLRFHVTVGDLGLELASERDVAEQARTLLGRPTTFVGRARELGTLTALFEESAGEPVACAVLVIGAAGLGKSRLRHELVERVRARGGVELWIARGDPMRAGAPFGVLAQLVRRTARLESGEPVEASRQKLLARVSRHVPAPERRRVAEFLGELAGVPFPDEDRVQLRAARQDPRLLGDQMRRAWVDFVDAETRAGPVALVLEDLHWGDAPSAEYVGAALRLLRERPLFVLGLARPEVHDFLPRLWHERAVQEIRLSALPRRACEQLCREVLGEETAPETIAELWERSAGNPFFLEEMLRASAEGRDGARLGTALALVGSRLDALDAEDRRRLRAGSVFGEIFWRGGLEALLGAEARLDRLVADEWIVPRPSPRFRGEKEYAFRHALVREAAYGMLTGEDRALGHRLAGAWLEAAGETDAPVMAEHHERGGDAEGAVRWSSIAVEQELEADDLPGVLARVDRAVALGAAGEALGRLSLARASAHHWRGEHAAAEPWAERAMAALPRGGARWCAAVEGVLWAAGARGDGARVAAAAEELLASAADEALVPHAVALTRAVCWLVLTGRYDRARAIQQAVELFSARFRDEPTVQASIAVARVYLVGPDDDPSAREALLAAAIARFEETGDRRQACLQRINLASVCNLAGDFAKAEALSRSSLIEAERLGVSFAARAAQSNLGVSRGRQGAGDEAARVLQAVIADSAANDDCFTLGVAHLYLAEAWERAGDLAAAEAEARRALPALGAFPPYLCLARARLAAALLAKGRTGEAIGYAREAFEALEALGAIDEGEALVRVVYGEALRAGGDEEGARAVLIEARNRLLAAAARFHDEAARRRFLTDVPDHARTLGLAGELLRA